MTSTPPTTPAWMRHPSPPSKELWRHLRHTRGSLMRELMNIEIGRMTLSGTVLDVGGGAKASYHQLLKGHTDLISVNIDPEIEPTLIVDLAIGLPFADGEFDAVVSFNTLEHLADDQFALDEMVRVLKPGGHLFLLVPFLYRVHGHPNDFHRHTASGWNLMLQRAGIPSDHQQIRPLVWDPLSTAWSIADVAPLGRNWWRARRFLRPWVLRRPLVMSPIDKRFPGDTADLIGEYALAYVCHATKPQADPPTDGGPL